MKTIAQILYQKANDHPDHTAFIFLDEDGMSIREKKSYFRLDLEARTIAAMLRVHVKTGNRVLLLYPPGLDFVSAFFGCLYAGVIPVPLYPPSRNQKVERVESVMRDADAQLALTVSSLKQKLDEQFIIEFPDVRLTTIATNIEMVECADANGVSPFSANPESLAFLQYSSGSTGTPKGVMISHANIIHNAQTIAMAMGLGDNTVVCSWLPMYHDMGLVGKVLETVFLGTVTVLMSPAHVLQRPLNWLKAISRYRATASGGPNFIYDYCVRKYSAEACEDLDLSSWEMAFCGAEPVRANTAIQFARTFAPHGFRKDAFYPCYGMAEATLFISGGKKGQSHTVVTADRDSLQMGQIRAPNTNQRRSDAIELVGCGQSKLDMDIRVVDMQTHQFQPDNRVGEIWVRGKSVAMGYWNATEATKESFQAFSENGEGPFLRTGDLGFIREKEVFVTGRSKDLIIIRGRNYYPGDIEAVLESASPAIQPGRSIAFTIEQDDEERLVVVTEVQRQALRRLDGESLVKAIRETVADNQGIGVSGVTLLKPGQLPVTSSGKVRRNECRTRYIEKQLDSIFDWRTDAVPSESGVSIIYEGTCANDSATRADGVIGWLREFSSRRINTRLMDDRRSLSPHIVLELGRQGVLGMSIPESYGGLGLLDVDTLRVVQQLGAIDISLSGLVGIHLALGAHPILHHASPDLRAELLPQIAEGRMLASFGVTEPEAGSHPRALQATARQVSSGNWLLNGEKWWVGNGSWAGVMNVFVRTQDEAGTPLGISGFVLDASNPGLFPGEEAQTMGVRGMVQNIMHLRDAPVNEARMLGTLGDGMKVAQDAMATGRLGIAAMSVGAMKRCAQLFYRYASRRNISTGKLLDNPVTIERLSYISHATTAVETLVQCLARLRDGKQSVPDEAYAVVKIVGPEFAWRAVDWTMQGLGGRGYMENSGLPQMMRDIRLLRIFEGPTETLQMFVGQSALRQSDGLYRFLNAQLGANTSAKMLEETLAELRTPGRERVAPYKDSLAQQRWLAFLCGELVTWALLAAALESAPSPQGYQEEALAWALHQFQRRSRTLMEPRQNAIAFSGLAGRIESFAQSIGDIEPVLPGMNVELDPLLRRDHVLDKTSPDIQTKLQAVANIQTRTQPGPIPFPVGAVEIETWLCAWIAKELHVDIGTVSPGKMVTQHGLDSLSAAELLFALEEWLGLKLQPDILWEQSSIRAMATYLAKAQHHPSAAHGEGSGGNTVGAGTLPTTEGAPHTRTETAVDKPEPIKQWPSFSLFFFGEAEDGASREKYNLILDAARYADQKGFEAIWTPERHFHTFGSSFPNPAVLGAALAQTTQRLQIRAGSVVLPLHNSLRVAEEWALVDSLSGGRVGIGVTPGWNPNDFVLVPDAYDQRMAILSEHLQEVRQLWRGESLTLPNGLGQTAEVRVFPRPVQPELPVWITCNRRREGFVEAGALGVNLLTALLSQSREDLAENIAAYRRSLLENGHNPQKGRVTLMLHTFIGEDTDEVKALVRPPMTEYLRNSADLWQDASERLKQANKQTRERLLEVAFDRYFNTSALFGGVESCAKTVKELTALGIDEIACLVDFGLPNQTVLQGLKNIERLAGILEKTEKAGATLTGIAVSTPKKQPKPWIVTETPRPTASLRLFCLPYAGGSARTFRGWVEQFPSPIEVSVIDAPQSLDTLDEVLNAILPELLPLLDRPFAFYGHSVGALIAFELARILRRKHNRLPMHLLVGAQHAPHLPFPHPSHAELSTPAGLRFLERQQSLNYGELDARTAHHRLVERLGPGMRIQNEHYQWVEELPLACPLTAMHGEHDNLLDMVQVEAWQRHSLDKFTLDVIPGGHLFVHDQSEAVITLLTEVLMGAITTD